MWMFWCTGACACVHARARACVCNIFTLEMSAASAGTVNWASAAVKQRQVGGEGLEERTKNGDGIHGGRRESAGARRHARAHKNARAVEAKHTAGHAAVLVDLRPRERFVQGTKTVGLVRLLSASFSWIELDQARVKEGLCAFLSLIWSRWLTSHAVWKSADEPAPFFIYVGQEIDSRETVQRTDWVRAN